jgi:hypothetical protein
MNRSNSAPHRAWTTDIADAARYMAVAAREIAPPPPASERPPGISMSDMTMDQFMDLEDIRLDEWISLGATQYVLELEAEGAGLLKPTAPMSER